MKTSQQGLDLIKKWEGLKTEAYLCPARIWTIGYGHTGAAGDPKPAKGMEITEGQAEDILRRDLGQYERAVSKAITRTPSQSQFDAMVSLCFNIGAGAFARSTCVRRINAGNIEGAAEALTWFNKAGGKTLRGLVNRRSDERALFLSDVEYHDDDPQNMQVEGGEAKPITKSKTAGAGAIGLVTAGLAAWSQFKETAPEVIELAGPYVPWVMVAIMGFVMFNRWRESQAGEH